MSFLSRARQRASTVVHQESCLMMVGVLAIVEDGWLEMMPMTVNQIELFESSLIMMHPHGRYAYITQLLKHIHP